MILGAYTATVAVLPELRIAAEAAPAQVLTGLAATAAAASVSFAALAAYAVLGVRWSLSVASAFLVLAIAAAERVVVSAGSGSAPVSNAAADVLRTLSFLLATAIIAFGVTWPRDVRAARARAAILVLAPGIALGLGIVLVGAVSSTPQLIDPVTQMPAEPAVLLHAAAIAISVVAALATRQCAPVVGTRAATILAAAAVWSVFGQLHYALFPDAGVSAITSGDVLLAGFAAATVLALGVSARSTVAELALTSDGSEAVPRAVLAERSRVAREIHDGPAQDLWLAKLALEHVRSAGSVEEAHAAAVFADGLLDRAIVETRQRIFELRATPGVDLDSLLRTSAAEFTRTSGVPVEVHVAGAGPNLPSSTSAEMAGIVGEAFANIRKHAGASVVRVEMRANRLGVEVRIADDGVGLRPRRPGSFGLDSMRERARSVGAEIRWESAPRSGTTVVIDLPALKVAS